VRYGNDDLRDARTGEERRGEGGGRRWDDLHGGTYVDN